MYKVGNCSSPAPQVLACSAQGLVKTSSLTRNKIPSNSITAYYSTVILCSSVTIIVIPLVYKDQMLHFGGELLKSN